MITFKVETEREDDGRWLAEVLELPGVLAYGESEDAALSKVQGIKVTSVDKLTKEQLAEYEKSEQESL